MNPSTSAPPAAELWTVGYCTNVHPGHDLTTIRSELLEHAVPNARATRDALGTPLGVGLWIPASAAEELAGDGVAERFAQWMAEHDLHPFTLNGFPYDNFHLPVVKHRVYQPTWADDDRLSYTIQLAEILHRLLPASSPVGSISTLPLGWPDNDRPRMIAKSGEHLRTLAAQLQRLEQRTGRRITVAIEPEPGCVLQRCDDILAFFASELPDTTHRRYLSVCHDVCHSAVMFEPQREVLMQLGEAGIEVGKVQISSAIDVPLERMTGAQQRRAIEQLSGFAEDRYLHQTSVIDETMRFHLVEDLPRWLSSPRESHDRHLRVHFHVPIFLDQFGSLGSTRDDIHACLGALRSDGAPAFTGHFEIETYAWGVLPESMRRGGLAADIASELAWFRQAMDS